MCILSGCDYLAPLGGIGLKTLHKYFLKHKTLDRVLYALRREANKQISKEYEIEFLKAELTFQHQRVYCPIERRLVYLNPLPDDIKSNMEIETVETFEDLNFLGPMLEVEMVRGIAEGIINPITFKHFIIEEPVKENNSIKQNTPKESPMKLNTLLKSNLVTDSNRLTMKRSANYSTIASTQSQSESIQNGLRYRFVNTPKYANVRKPSNSGKTKPSSDGKQFSILNFCVPKSSLNPEGHK
jgi:5'-3' exonuclease